MNENTPSGPPGPAPRSRVPHYVGLVAVVVVLVILYLIVR